MKINEFIKLSDEVGSWDFERLSCGNFKLHRKLKVKGRLATNDFTGPYWIYSKFNLKGGDTYYRQNQKTHRIVNNNFSLWLPPFSMIEIIYENVSVSGEMIIGREEILAIKNDIPLLIYQDNNELPMNLDVANRKILELSTSAQGIALSTSPSVLSYRCKHVLDRKFNLNIPISEVASMVNTSHSQMTRSFKKDFGITPIFYRNWMRVMTASFLLLEQLSISEVQEKIGFEDLSRFNKQFKKITHSTPKQFRQIKKSKNA